LRRRRVRKKLVVDRLVEAGDEGAPENLRDRGSFLGVHLEHPGDQVLDFGLDVRLEGYFVLLDFELDIPHPPASVGRLLVDQFEQQNAWS